MGRNKTSFKKLHRASNNSDTEELDEFNYMVKENDPILKQKYEYFQESNLPKDKILLQNNNSSQKNSSNAEYLKQVKEVDMHIYFPQVKIANNIVEREIKFCHRHKYKALKVIHGYGSHGVGGILRHTIRDFLNEKLKRHLIKDILYGEDWVASKDKARNLLKEIPALEYDNDLGRCNRGITIVIV